MEANTNVLFRRLHRPSEGRIRRTSGGSLDLDDDVTVNSAPFALFAAVHFFFEFSFLKKILSVRIQPLGRRHPRQFHSARSPAQRCEIFQRKYFVIFDQIEFTSRGDVLHDNHRPTYFPILDPSAQRPAGYLELSTQLKCT